MEHINSLLLGIMLESIFLGIKIWLHIDGIKKEKALIETMKKYDQHLKLLSQVRESEKKP